MKKAIALVLFLGVFAVCGLSQDASASTPIKLSLLPNIGIPQDNVVQGLDIGIIGDSLQEMQGVQWSWIYSDTKGKLSGVQFGLVNISNDVAGVQWGFYNQAKSVVGVQLGAINMADTLKGIQIGLVNIIRTGAPLPFMVIVNANF
jgi:hypothetical protein